MDRHPPLRAGSPTSLLALLALLLCGLAGGSGNASAATWPALLAAGDESDLPPGEPGRLIAFALYTVQDRILKLSAHLYPLPDGTAPEVSLEAELDGAWRTIAHTDVHPVGWTALFRVAGWENSRNVPYRVRHADGSVYAGTIRRDPADQETVTAAVFTGNSPGPGGGKISKRDVVDAVRSLDPDVLLFTGDQVYNHTRHTEHWLQFGETFGEMMRDRPTVCLPDDHDVGQPNLWGQGGRPIDLDTKGGYTRPAAYVQLAERQQTSHLPDPFDPHPIEQGIGVYYTALNVGGIDFALLEDRKFKSGCFDLDIVGRDLGPRPDHVENPDFDPATVDLPGRELLGERQMRFLREWGEEWDGVVMKAAVSQTVWSMASNFHSQGRRFYVADFDANGWPQSARQRAVDALRRCFAVHLCGDQHLGSLVQYGIDDWRDAGWAFCVPSIANLYPRWWSPREPGRNPEPGAQEHTGDYLDGFGNKLTVYAHTNPSPSGREPAELHDRMPGFGVARFHKPDRTITFECWPRMIDPADPANRGQQYSGWPRTIRQLDNDPRRPAAWLPEINVRGLAQPVIQVIDERDGETVYTLRAPQPAYRPAVFRPGAYTVRIGDGARWRSLPGIASRPQPEGQLEIDWK